MNAIPPFIRQFQHIQSAAEIQEVMRSPDFLQGRSEERDLFFGGSLVMLDGDEHVQRKKLFSSLFSPDSLAYYETRLLEPVITQAMSELRTRRGADGLARTDLVPLIRIMLHRIAAQVTGADDINTPERTERFRVLIAKLSEAAAGQWTTQDREKLIEEGVKARQALVDEFLLPSFERRLGLAARYAAGELSKEELPRDVLMLICLHGNDQQTEYKSYEAYVWRECALFLSASTQTTTHSLPNVVTHIAHWISEHPEDAHKINDTGFLRLAVGESLRLHQTAPVKMRIAARDVTLSSGRKIARDEQVAVFAPYANVDPELYGPDAAEFNPYRKQPAGIHPWGLTFGAGVHMCLGRSLVTGVLNRADEKTGAEGTIVKMLKVLYSFGMELDPDDPPKRMATSFHDTYETLPIILRKL